MELTNAAAATSINARRLVFSDGVKHSRNLYNDFFPSESYLLYLHEKIFQIYWNEMNLYVPGTNYTVLGEKKSYVK